MMNRWGEYSFVRAILPFACGILLLLVARVHIPLAATAGMMVSALLFHVMIRRRAISARRWLVTAGFMMQATLFCMGNELAWHADDLNHPGHYTYSMQQAHSARVRINDLPEEGENTIKATVDVLALDDTTTWKTTCGKAIIYLAKDSLAYTLRYGDVLLVKNHFQAIPPPQNPDDFDYRCYAALQNIFTTAYLRSGDYVRMPERKAFALFRIAYWMKQNSISALQHFVASPREAAVVEAMLIGERDDLSFNTKQSFTDAGVIHIIVVAGLHVGILFFILDRCLFFLDRKKQTRALKSVLIIGCIWIFALVTGLSGPVLRAALMFSLIAAGKNLQRSYNSFNVLAASAFILLVFNPAFIMEAGFQLSYLAVAGIMSLSPYIDGWVNRSNAMVNFIWKTVAASASAQIAVLPLTLLYFKQFPLYFLIANIVVIPLAFIIIFMGVALILVQAWVPVAGVIGSALQAVVWLMNEYIGTIQQLPAAVIHLPAFNVGQSFLLALGIMAVTSYFISKRKWMLPLSMASLTGIFLLSDLDYAHYAPENHFTVFAMNKAGAMEFSGNGQSFLFYNAAALDERQEFYFRQHWRRHYVNEAGLYTFAVLRQPEVQLSPILHQSGNVFLFHGWRVAVVDGVFTKKFSGKPLHVDAVVVSGNPRLRMNDVISRYNTPLLIFDETNSRYHCQRWQQQAQQLGVRTYDVRMQGAFVRSM